MKHDVSSILVHFHSENSYQNLVTIILLLGKVLSSYAAT